MKDQRLMLCDLPSVVREAGLRQIGRLVCVEAKILLPGWGDVPSIAFTGATSANLLRERIAAAINNGHTDLDMYKSDSFSGKVAEVRTFDASLWTA